MMTRLRKHWCCGTRDGTKNKVDGREMKTAVLTVAFYSEMFSKVFVGSFRKHYPDTPLVIVDNNMEETPEDWITAMGKRETWFLKALNEKDDLIMWVGRSKEGNRSHGIGLDRGMLFLGLSDVKIVLTVDIDSLFLKPGLIEKCEELHQKGYILGGRTHTFDDGTSYVHPSLAFYDFGLINGLSFEDEAQKESLSTGERIYRDLIRQGHLTPDPGEFKGHVHHFAGGSVLRTGRNFVKHKLLGKDAYKKKMKGFFDRPDVRCYL